MVTLKIDPAKKHKISPYLYMQFMEPLGVADPSVDAAWNFTENDWHSEVIDMVRDLAPTMVRFGGTIIDYYHWQEAVGKHRTPIINHCWGGVYQNQVGTHEVIDFCRRVGAEPLLMVNMESDGFKNWSHPKNDSVRLGTVEEAARWVRYCNDPDDPLRIANGADDPFRVKYWQIGNETSYRIRGHVGFDLEGCYDATGRFADAMRSADPSLTLIGWGDKDYAGNNWCKKMSELDSIDILAFHHHFDSGLENSPLIGTDYRNDIEETWRHLMHAHHSLDDHIQMLRADCGGKRLAMTEGHYILKGRNRNEVLSSWGAGVSYARCLNVIMRHSDILDIATMADFFGTVWQVNALMLPAPFGSGTKPYFQPVGSVMRLFGQHQGEYALDCGYQGALDCVASATGSKVFLHLVNTDMHSTQHLSIDLGGKTISSATMHYIAQKPDVEITPVNTDVFAVQSIAIDPRDFTLPAAAVAAIECTVEVQ